MSKTEHRKVRKSRKLPSAPATGTAFDLVRLPIPCPECGKVIRKPFRQLVASDSLKCPSPDCGHCIDLTTKESRAYLRHFSEFFAQFKTVAPRQR